MRFLKSKVGAQDISNILVFVGVHIGDSKRLTNYRDFEHLVT